MKIRKLNTLRGLAAFIVVITHFSDITGWLDGILGGRAGQYGVMLFFMLSGFLMAHLYFGRHFDSTNIKSYAIARISRVIPLYLLIVLSSYALSTIGLQGMYDIPDNQALISHMLFLYGESVLWSIAPEIHFYFLFVGLWFIANWRPAYIYAIVVSVLIALFFFNYPRPYGSAFGLPYDFHIFRSLPYFLIGVVFGMAYQSITIPNYLKSHYFVAALLLIPLMYPDLSPVISDAKMKMWLSYEVLFVVSSVFFAVVFLVPDHNSLLANTVGDFIGKVSYSLYLLHMPIILHINKYAISIELKLLLAVSLSLIAAYLSYMWFERPAATFIRNISAKQSHTQTNNNHLQEAQI